MELVSSLGADLCTCDAALKRRSQMTYTLLSLWIEMGRILYLWRSSEERVADDLHLIVLADRDGACGQVLEGEDCSSLGDFKT